MIFDCQKCGACCCNTRKNVLRGERSYIEVLPSDALYHDSRLTALTVIDDTQTHQMRLVDNEQRCTALEGTLGESVRCQIYDVRPSGCRDVQPGDDECRKARRLHRPRGIDHAESVAHDDPDELF